MRQKTFLKPSEASQYFRVSLGTIYLWYGQGKIEGIKVNGKCLRIYRRSLQALLDSRMQTKKEGDDAADRPEGGFRTEAPLLEARTDGRNGG
jgi:excisionase family DNA binding protein